MIAKRRPAPYRNRIVKERPGPISWSPRLVASRRFDSARIMGCYRRKSRNHEFKKRLFHSMKRRFERDRTGLCDAEG